MSLSRADTSTLGRWWWTIDRWTLGALLILVGVEGLSYAEAACTLEMPIGTVMSRLSRARKALRALEDGDRPSGPQLRRQK